MEPLWGAWLGRIAYQPAFAMQQRVAARRAAGELPDSVLMLEHEPVYTLGRRATDGEVLLDAAMLEQRGIEVAHTDRGGRVTYHGPGQLVGYPIVDLGAAGDLVGYVRRLERALVALAADFGVTATTIEGLTGIWVGDAKLGAIGVHVSRGITTHGFAFNVAPDLDAFNGIVPCGIVDKSVTSLEQLTGQQLPMPLVFKRAGEHLADALERELRWRHPTILAGQEERQHG